MVSLPSHHKTDKQFNEEEWIYLKIQPYKQLNIQTGPFLTCQPSIMAPIKLFIWLTL